MKSVAWEQFVYGKLVTHPDGPIVQGFDHDVTGRSPGVPRDLLPRITPTTIGIGSESQLARYGGVEAYPWIARGGGISSGVVHHGEPWVVVARVNFRRERPDGPRFYTQAHTAMVRARDWHQGVLPSLEARLDVRPMLVRDDHLPTLTTDLAWMDSALPPGWLDALTPWLEVVMSGRPLSIRENLEVPDIVAHAATLLCALPAALAWRAPFGAGVIVRAPGHTFAWSTLSDEGVTIFKGARRGTEGVDLMAGAAWVRLLRARATGAGTPRELCDAVRELLPRFSAFDAVESELAWPAVVEIINADLRRGELVSSIRAWRPDGAALLPALGKPHADTLRELLQHLGDARGEHIVTDTLDPAWRGAWDAVLQESAPDGHKKIAALASLLGVRGAVDPGIVAALRNVDLADALAIRAIGALHGAIESSPSSARWEVLAHPSAEDRPWLVRWRQDAALPLFVRALARKETALYNELRGSAPAVAWRAIREDADVTPRCVEDVMRVAMALPPAVFEAWFNELKPLARCRIADAFHGRGDPPPPVERFFDEALPRWEGLPGFFADMQGEAPPTGPLPLTALRVIAALPAPSQLREPPWKERFAREVEAPVRAALGHDDPPETDGTRGGEVLDLAVAKLSAHPSNLTGVLRAMQHATRPHAQAIARELLRRSLLAAPGAAPPPGWFAFARALAAGQRPPGGIPPRERLHAMKLLKTAGMPVAAGTFAYLVDADEVHAALHLTNSTTPPMVLPEALAALLARAAREQEDTLALLLRARGWEQAPSWRLVEFLAARPGGALAKLKPEEESALERVEDVNVLLRLALHVELPRLALDWLAKRVVDSPQLALPTAYWLALQGRTRGHDRIRRAAGHLALRHARTTGTPSDQARERLLEGRGIGAKFLHWIAGSGPPVGPDSAPMALAAFALDGVDSTKIDALIQAVWSDDRSH